MPKLFLSHRLDLLSRRLGQELAEVRRGIFEPVVILVPNRFLKQWLLIQIAKDSVEQGVAGLKVATLHEATELFFAPSGNTEIFCATYRALEGCQNEEIASYLQESPSRILQLANRLTSLFIRYGRYCPALFEPNSKEGGWQEELIQTLFVKGPLRVFAQMAPLSLPRIHCFGFDYLPESVWKMFNFSSIYLFSPCAHYWEDLLTDRERKRIGLYWKKKGASLAKLEELEEYLTKVPPLLANWGRAGRETLRILEGAVDELVEDYQSDHEDTNLGRLQKRLLEFHVGALSAYVEDSSIQISLTGASLLKEVEQLRKMILELVEEKKLLFSDIHVFAPDIQPYVPLIQLLFSDLPYRISEMAQKSFFTQGMHRLFQLGFNPEDLLALFENPSFCKARGWDADFLERVKEWQRESEEELLDRFIFLFPEKQDLIAFADALEQLIAVRQSLRSDLAMLSTPRTLLDWSEFLTSLVQKYLCVDSSNEAEDAAWNFFEKTMEELRRTKEGALFPFACVEMLLKRPVPGCQIHAGHLHAIRFSSIDEGAILPARALFFIGMTEDNFPGNAAHPSLDLSKGYRYDCRDRDRYLFLQALLAAKESLHFSYCHLSPEGNPVNPSSLIQELARNLDAPIKENRVPLSLENKRENSYFPWPEKPTPAIPQGEWTIALSALSSLARHPWEFYLQKKMGIRFEGSDEESFSRETNKILRESLRRPLENIVGDLPIPNVAQKLATGRVQSAENRLEQRGAVLPPDTAPPSVPIDFRPLSIPPSGQFLSHVRYKGICGEALAQKIEESSKEWTLRLREWDLSIETASLRRSCQKMRREGNRWEFPSLELEPAAGLKIYLTGEVKTFSTKGFVHSGSDQIDGLLRVWPECLAALVLSGKQEIHCLKSGRIRRVEEPKQALNAFLLYYFLAEAAPSPLLADWASSILRKKTFEWDEKTTQYEDPAWKWVVERTSLPPADRWLENWQEPLESTFSELTKIWEKHASV